MAFAYPGYYDDNHEYAGLEAHEYGPIARGDHHEAYHHDEIVDYFVSLKMTLKIQK